MQIHVVDAFTDRPFSGNPAGVCLLGGPAEAGWMQQVAAEMRHAETAFVYPEGEGWNLRWFTPTVEVDLCGHATLASAHILFETEAVAPDDTVTFYTASGPLHVQRHPDGRLAMDFPATPPEAAPLPDAFPEVFGFTPAWEGRSRFDLFAVAPDEATVRALHPDEAAVAALGSRGVIVTARSEDSTEADVVSRFFAPGSGVPEDPVTGSAHCAIGPYWAHELSLDSVRCYQASPRGGFVHVTPSGDRVTLVGPAVTVLRGELLAVPSLSL
ncbi:MAG: PhzF family phenazine biosynthesis protein [Bacteroidota bacterium]